MPDAVKLTQGLAADLEVTLDDPLTSEPAVVTAGVTITVRASMDEWYFEGTGITADGTAYTVLVEFTADALSVNPGRYIAEASVDAGPRSERFYIDLVPALDETQFP